MQLPAPPRLYWPTAHIFAVLMVDPARQAYPALQLPEHAGEVRPTVPPNDPAAQSAHEPHPDSEY